MEFLELELDNLFSFRKQKISLANRGVVLVSGKNGAGKSSLAGKAISWTLFGETPGGAKGDGVVNVQHPTDYAAGIVRFSAGETQHQVIRHRNPHGVEIDGARWRQQAEGQKVIEQLIGRDLDVFLNTDYFGQDRGVDFLSSTPSAQMDVLEGTLRLSRLDLLVERTKVLAATVRTAITERETIIHHFNGSLRVLDSQARQIAERLDGWARQKENFQRELVDLDQTDLAMQLETLGLRLTEAQQNRLDFRGRLDALDRDLSEAQRTEQAITYSVQLLTSHITAARAGVRPIEEAICPTCKNPVDPALTTSLRAQQQAAQVKVQELEIERAKETRRLEQQCEIVRELSRELRTAAEKFNEVDHAIHQFEIEQQRLTDRRCWIEQSLSKGAVIEAELTMQHDNLCRDIDITQKNMQQSTDVLAGLLDRQSKLQFWLDVFTRSFKNFIVEQALPFLEERTLHHLRLLNNPDIKVRFSTTKVLKSGEERNLFHVIATREQGGQAYESLSGGEKQMAAFAVGLALSELADSQTGSPSNLMILDEPFTELDSANCESVIHYVTTELVKRKATILLISNDERMKQLIPQGIHVERGEDGISNVSG